MRRTVLKRPKLEVKSSERRRAFNVTKSDAKSVSA